MVVHRLLEGAIAISQQNTNFALAISGTKRQIQFSVSIEVVHNKRKTGAASLSCWENGLRALKRAIAIAEQQQHARIGSKHQIQFSVAVEVPDHWSECTKNTVACPPPKGSIPVPQEDLHTVSGVGSCEVELPILIEIPDDNVRAGLKWSIFPTGSEATLSIA